MSSKASKRKTRSFDDGVSSESTNISAAEAQKSNISDEQLSETYEKDKGQF